MPFKDFHYIFLFRNKVTVLPLFWPSEIITIAGQTEVKDYRNVVLVTLRRVQWRASNNI